MFKVSKTLAASFFLLGAGIAAAQADAISERQHIFEGMGDATKPVVAMMKGQAPFDLSKVQAALRNYADAAKALPNLFPAGSDKGKTEASPKIWDNKTRFDAGLAQLGSDATAAAAAIKDEATFKPNFSRVLGNCKSCHDDFRIEKK